MPSHCNCQQDELYASELGVPQGRMLSPGELQAFVDELAMHPYWNHYPMILGIDAFVRPPSWTGGSVGGFHSEANSGKIEMARCHLCELFVIHELAHVLADARYGCRSHGPWFASTYLELVYHHMGSEVYKKLYDSFVEHGIEFTHDSTPRNSQAIAL